MPRRLVGLLIAGSIALVNATLLAFALVYGATDRPALARPVALLPTTRVTGVVVAASGPISGATVRVQASDRQTLTAEDGSFSLETIAARPIVTITAWAKGYYIGWGAVSPESAPFSISAHAHYPTDTHKSL